MNHEDLFTQRQGLHEICTVPDKIISVYSLEKHVWADSNSEASRKARKPELQTIEEFQIDPVRPFLTDILRNMAAPWKRDERIIRLARGIGFRRSSAPVNPTCCAVFPHWLWDARMPGISSRRRRTRPAAASASPSTVFGRMG